MLKGPKDAQVIVVGLGVIGAMAVWRLAQSGYEVTGLDAFQPGHQRGGSHGRTRIFRTLNWEGAEFSDLALHARSLYHELSASAGTQLIVPHPFVAVGQPGRGNLEKVLLQEPFSFGDHVISDVESLTWISGIERGALAVHDGWAGILRAEDTVHAATSAGTKAGATILTGHVVSELRSTNEGVKVVADDLELTADAVIVAPGMYARGMKAWGLRSVEARRSPLVWFDFQNQAASRSAIPAFAVESTSGSFWGLPDIDAQRMKVGGSSLPMFEGRGTDEILEQRLNELQSFVARSLPGVDPRVADMTTCHDAYTADGRFLVGSLAADPRIVVATGMSGHGFKHAPAIGEAVASLATGRELQGALRCFVAPIVSRIADPKRAEWPLAM